MVNALRSPNAELAEGMSDGKYKKVNQDRGGVVEGTTYASRTDLDDTYFGIHETYSKVLPDGTARSTPGYIRTPEVNALRF